MIAEALLGAVLGLAAGAVGAIVLVKTVRLLGSDTQTGRGVALTLTSFILKWPILIGCGYIASTISMTAVILYLIGVVAVYSAVVWRALARQAF